MGKNLLATEELLVVLAFGFVAALMLFFYVPDFQSIGLATSPILKAGAKIGISSPSLNPVVEGPSIGIGGPAGATCGNGVLDAHEECDGTHFRLYGNGLNQCMNYSALFESGNLQCFEANDIFGRECTINSLLCSGPLHADFKVYKRVSENLWQEVNLQTEELELNTHYFFDGLVSVGENYENSNYSVWDFGFGGNSYGIILSRQFNVPGVHDVSLTIYDDLGNFDQVTKQVTVAGETSSVCPAANGHCESSCSLSEELSSYSAGNASCYGGSVCCVPTYLVGEAQRTVNVNGVNVNLQVVLENGFEQYADLKLNGAVKRIWSGNLNQDLYFGGCSVRVLQSNWSGDPPSFVSLVARVWGCSQPINICGNLLLQQNEQCDGPVFGIENCQLAGFDGGSISCNTSACTLNTSACTSVCGNGKKSSTEQCDDAGLCADNVTLCTSAAYCTANGSSGPCTPRSGDGCNAQCVAEYCGDGVVNNAPNGVPTEQCDDGNQNNNDSCSTACQFIVPGSLCGNGVLSVGEQCDNGGVCQGDMQTQCTNNQVCVEANVPGSCVPVSGDGCSVTCQNEFCGDGIVNDAVNGAPVEECDDGNQNNNDSCSNACQDNIVAGVCGDGVLNLFEECEIGNLGEFGNGVNQCDNYSSAFTSGNLLCFQADDPIDRGCTINYLNCDGPLNADFKIYKYVTQTTFAIVNPLVEELNVGDQYIFDSAYSVGETSANWDFGAGSLEQGIAVFYTFDSPGVYSVVLTAFDGEGASDTQIKQVTVGN